MLQLAAIFGENMVMQADTPAAIFGEADPGAGLVIRLGQQTARVLAGGDGRFLTWLPMPPAGETVSLSLRNGGETLEIQRILSGQVFIAAGQSNMEFALRDSKGGAKAAREANDPELCFYHRRKAAGSMEDAPVSPRDDRWLPAAPENAPLFSGVAYFFARELRRTLGVPVGIIECYWGGTFASCWQSAPFLEADPALRVYETEYAAYSQGRSPETYLAQQQTHMEVVAAYQAAVEAARARMGDDFSYMQVDAPSSWPPVEGSCGFRRPFGLYTTMLEALFPFTVKGVLWYQGESDDIHASLYGSLFRQMVACWRQGFRNPGLPFFTVQLAEFAGGSGADGLEWGAVREQQRLAAREYGIHMVTALGTGERDNIHPVDKAPVGRRLANCVLDRLFGLPREYTGPRLEGCRREPWGMVLSFSHAAGLCSHGEIRGLYADTPIQAEIRGETLCLRWQTPPTRLGYACANWNEGSLTNASGFPMEAFLLNF